MPPRRLRAACLRLLPSGAPPPAVPVSPPTAMSSKQRLVFSIIDFLNQSIDDGTVKQDDKESLEVASASRTLASARKRVS